MKQVNLVMMWVCIGLVAVFAGLFVYWWAVDRTIEPMAIVLAIGAGLTARVFRKRQGETERLKSGGSKLAEHPAGTLYLPSRATASGRPSTRRGWSGR